MKKYISVLFLSAFLLVPSLSLAQTTGDVNPNPVASTCVSITHNIAYRTRDTTTGGDVSTLQDFLQSNNYLNNEPTGYAGLLTVKAIKAFQSANNITSSGYVGPVTRAMIAKVSGCTTTPTTSTSTTNSNVGYTGSGAGYAGVSQHFFSSVCASGQAYSSITGLPCSTTNNSSTSPSITVLSPNGGENYKSTDSIAVNFAYYNFPTSSQLTAFLIKKDGEGSIMSNTIDLPVPPYNIYHTATLFLDLSTVPYISSGQYQVQICGSNSSPCDSSDNYFTITSSNIIPTTSPFTVTFPTANTTLQVGQTYSLAWTGSDPNVTGYFVHLLGGPNNVNIVLGSASPTADGNIGTFSWTVPSTVVAGSNYQIQFGGEEGIGGLSPSFSVANVSGVSVTSSLNVNVSASPIATPSITVISPNGGEKFTSDQEITVKWNTKNLNFDTANHDIFIGIKNIDTGKQYFFGSFPDNGSTYLPPVDIYPNDIDLGNNEIVICGTKLGNEANYGPANVEDCSTSDYSDNPFTISASATRQPLIFTFPSLSDQLHVGQTYNVTWTGQDVGVDNYSISLLGGPGGSSTPVGTVSSSSNSFSWTVPSNVKLSSSIGNYGDYFLQFTGKNVSDTSFFNIVAP